jgi:TolB protein
LYPAPLSWSHDGTRLVFVSDKDNRSDLFLYDLNRKKAKPIKQDLRVNSFPAFLPGDEEVGFVAKVDGFADIYKINLDNGKLTPLTQTTNDEAYPHWSSDGKFLVFSREYRMQFDLVLKDLGSGKEIRLTDTAQDEIWPLFLPGAEAILFVSDETGIFNLHLLDLRSAATHLLSKVIGGIFAPRVSSDGQRLLFSYFRHGQYKIFENAMLPWEPGVANGSGP